MLHINYYNRKGEIKKILFEDAFYNWINASGGVSKSIRIFKAMNKMELDNIPLYFLLHFQSAYDATLPEDTDSNYQSYIYSCEFYYKQLNGLIQEHQNRAHSPQNIVAIIVLAGIILGINSMCS
jgi:hypothetical protein